MRTQDWIMFGCLAFIILLATYRGWRRRIWQDDIELKQLELYLDQQRLQREWVRFKKQRNELYASLADPEKIEADLEKSADLREMRDAGRTTLPREDAGPPATVHRPPLRSPVVGSWNPRSPGSPSKY